MVEHLGHGSSGVVVAQESEKELRLGPEEGEEDLAALQGGDDAVHLGGDEIRMLGEEGQVVRKGAVLAAGTVDLERALKVGRLAACFSGQVKVSGGEQA